MKTLSAFLLTGEPSLKPNRNLNEASATRLEKLAQTLHKGARLSIEFTTGMGLSEIGFPERLPAIAIPTLRAMERLDGLGVHDVHYTLYQAREFLISEQGLDPNNSLKISNRMENFIHDHIRRRYPHLEKNTNLIFDKKIDPEELEKIKEFLRQSDSPDMQKIISYAISKGKEKESAYTYAAANIVCNLYADKTHHIVIGGEKERPFFRLGQAYEALNPDNPQSIFLIQSTGHIPPYYPQKGEESYFDRDGNRVPGPEFSTNKYIAHDQSIL